MDPGDDVNLVNEIKALQADRQHHAEAIAKIDATLARISKMLSSMLLANGTATPAAAAPVAAPRHTHATSGGRPHKYRKLPLKGDEFVLDLLKQRGSATTLEINGAWKAQGRGGLANNVLVRLLKQRLIAREPLEGRRGSRYRLTDGPATEVEPR
jgi:hypothetical protein